MTLHVFYGIPCVGKTTIAASFACRQNISTIIHTDYIREVQRACTPAEQAPALAKVSHNAWELYGSPTRQNVITGFVSHVDAVAPALKAVTKKLVSDAFDAVIEGVHFHGRVIEDLRSDNTKTEIMATLLIVDTAAKLLRNIKVKEARRAEGAIKKSWLDRVEVMLAIQEFLILDSAKYRIPVTVVS